MCFFFCCLRRGAGPAQTATKKKTTTTTTRPSSKKSTRPRPFRACFFCCLGGWASLFVAVWTGGVIFFCCLGGVLVFFAVWAGSCFFFAVWAGGVFFCCCLLAGGYVCVCVCVFFLLLLFFAVCAGDRNSLTCPSAWLFFKRPSNKKDQTAKTKKTRVPP